MKRLLWVTLIAGAAVVAASLLAAPASAQSALAAAAASQQPSAGSDNPPVVFLHDPAWPAYAQTEITVRPEPPIPGQPVEICAWVANTTGAPQSARLEFGIANFGIGLPFTPIGGQTVAVPPHSQAKACVVWVPRQEGHWCIQATLRQAQQPDLVSQRNIDIWEALEPGVPAVTAFPVRNPLASAARVRLEARANPARAGWGMSVTPADVQLGPGQQIVASLVVTPPAGALLGSREPIVDVEATAYPEQAMPRLIGGFRKLDWPPVPLHVPGDPPYAESEISVEPYPPLAGEPARLCVELRNLSEVSQTVEVEFQVSPQVGIGLPFDAIGRQTVTLPPHGRLKLCTAWLPPRPGQFCVQVWLFDPGHKRAPQQSQRNLDVDEILLPGQPAVKILPIGNPNPFTTTIELTTTRASSFFDVWLDALTLPDMAPGEIRPVALHVVPGPGPLPEDGTPVVDVEASFLNAQRERILIGGIRKVFRPPVPIHRPQEPPYAEGEISVVPYPPRAGEPVVVCAELRNPTAVTQTVDVAFGVANFGIGLPFLSIDRQTVELPPHSRARICTRWVPPIGGHFCVQILIRQPGYRDVFSQRNIDVAEYLKPGTPDAYAFPVGNPFDKPVTVTLGLVSHLAGWRASLSDDQLTNLSPGARRWVTLTVTPAGDLRTVEDQAPVVDVEAYADGRLLGGFRKLFRPPIPIHRPEDPPYAEREISVEPYPPRAGEPTELCVELRNPTSFSQTIEVEFAVADFGIGLPFHPVQRVPVTVPPHSVVKTCMVWVPPSGGRFCVQVSLIDPQQRYPVVRSQRNLDVGEVFVPGRPTQPFVFLVRNPLPVTAAIQLASLTHWPGWEASIEPRALPQLAPGETRPVTLTVFVPDGPLPPDEAPVVDVEAYAAGQLIGGFRKLYRPPVPVHRPQDPMYAESEITIQPYPPREREPTELCAEVRNPTDQPQVVSVTFGVANFGIGLPFHDIARPISVTVPPHSFQRVCVTWVPPFGGHFCAQVTLQMPGYQPVRSQRNMDVSEILVPGVPSTLAFPVGNPARGVATVTLGLVPHLDGWQFELAPDVLAGMQPGAVRPVTLTATPPHGQPMPPDGAPVVDVEAFIGRELIGGIRKIYRPPVPVHPSGDPVYAESEIFVDPYPTRVGLPTLLGAVVYNPTPSAQRISVTFGVAHFGIGMPFGPAGILTPTLVLNVPPMGSARARTTWTPWFGGHFCVQITLQSAGHAPVWSQRNIDVGEPLRPDLPHARLIEVRNPLDRVVTITMALINHRGPDWTIALTPTTLRDVAPGAIRPVTLTVRPPSWEGLADERPIADVEAYVDGRLIGGIRKIAKPPVPLHKPQDRPYAETEIGVTPYPLLAGRPATITTDIINTSPDTQTVRVSFGVANFGVGIPFTTTGIAPTMTVATLGPGVTRTVAAAWTPPGAGHWCVQVILENAAPGVFYPPQRSQRNVSVERRPYEPCAPFSRDFRLQNSTPLTATVTLGASAVNLPSGWTYSTNVTQTVLGPFQGVTVTLTITPPCGLSRSPVSLDAMLDTGGASGPPTIDVEGYDESGQLLGGVQVQLEGSSRRWLYLPILRKS